jgi:hypothetical protein
LSTSGKGGNEECFDLSCQASAVRDLGFSDQVPATRGIKCDAR